MRKKLDNQDVDARIAGRGIERMNNIESAQSRIDWKCTQCDNEWNAQVAKVIRGTGCPTCSRVGGDAKRRCSVDQFIDKSKVMHGNKYTYDKVVYVNSHARVSITCPVHGNFYQSPTSHLSGNGCSKCMTDDRRHTYDQFVSAAQRIHGNAYTYDRFAYINNLTKGLITCWKHGDFLQKPNVHLVKRAGCPKCDHQSRKGSYSEEYFQANPTLRNVPGWIYVIQLDDYIKVGITKNLTQRTRAYYGRNKVIRHVATMTMYEAYALEQQILKLYEIHQISTDEKFDGYTECFYNVEGLADMIIDSINQSNSPPTSKTLIP